MDSNDSSPAAGRKEKQSTKQSCKQHTVVRFGHTTLSNISNATLRGKAMKVGFLQTVWEQVFPIAQYHPTGISKELANPNEPEPLSAEPEYHWEATGKQEQGIMLIKSLKSKALYIHCAKEFLELSMLEV